LPKHTEAPTASFPLDERRTITFKGWAFGAYLASGVSALVFEMLWLHQAGLAFGNGVWASALVLGAFMAGLGLGNHVGTRLGDRLARPLRAFAALEFSVGVAGVGVVWLLPALGPSLASLALGLERFPTILGALRFCGALTLLAVPSIAMGMTLPVIVRASTANTASFGPTLGLLYGANTLGAVLGVIAADLVLVRAFGIRGSAIAAASINAIVSATAFWLSRTVPGPSIDPTAPDTRTSPGGQRLLYAGFLCGFIALALEVVWVRFMLLLVNDTPSAFAAMLCAVLAGVALGSLCASALIARRPALVDRAAMIALGAGVTGVLGYRAYPFLFDELFEIAQEPSTIFLVAVPLVMPTAMASGALFAFIGAALREVTAGDAAAAGRLACANTLGAALGPFAAGFALLPTLGMESSLWALLAGFVAVAALLVRRSATMPRALGLGSLAVFAATLATFPFGSVRDRYVAASVARWTSPGDETAAVREGTTATLVHIRHRLEGRRLFDQITTNAYSMTSNGFDARRYMALFAVLPAAIHPRIERVLLVGYGIGNTAAALTRLPNIREIHVADISEEMLDLSRDCLPEGTHESPLDDPRARLHLEDGRQVLHGSDVKYDLITGEPPPPIMAGVSNLYSAEYFRLVRTRLANGGMATHWLPTMNISAPTARAIIAAFCDGFPDCSLWHGSGENFVLLGTMEATGPVQEAHFAGQWADSTVREALGSIGLEAPEQLGALFIAGADTLTTWVDGTVPIDDDHPKRMFQPGTQAEHEALLADFRNTGDASRRFEASDWVKRLWPETYRRRTLPYFEAQHLIDVLLTKARSPLRTTRTLHQVLQHSPLRFPALLLMASSPDAQRALARHPPSDASSNRLRVHAAAGRLAARDFRGAAGWLAQVPESELPYRDVRRYIAHVIQEREHRVGAPEAVRP
jgi:spermidine synthase